MITGHVNYINFLPNSKSANNNNKKEILLTPWRKTTTTMRWRTERGRDRGKGWEKKREGGGWEWGRIKSGSVDRLGGKERQRQTQRQRNREALGAKREITTKA